jgi:hypothetical protein
MVSDSELQNLNARALQTSEEPAYTSTDVIPVKRRVFSKPIYWTGRQWAVTKFGIEARNGDYKIPRNRVWEENSGQGWIEHMAEKGWVDIHDFTEALRLARSRWPMP